MITLSYNMQYPVNLVYYRAYTGGEENCILHWGSLVEWFLYIYHRINFFYFWKYILLSNNTSQAQFPSLHFS